MSSRILSIGWKRQELRVVDTCDARVSAWRLRVGGGDVLVFQQ
jgi:hypothetical protein